MQLNTVLRQLTVPQYNCWVAFFAGTAALMGEGRHPCHASQWGSHWEKASWHATFRAFPVQGWKMEKSMRPPIVSPSLFDLWPCWKALIVHNYQAVSSYLPGSPLPPQQVLPWHSSQILANNSWSRGGLDSGHFPVRNRILACFFNFCNVCLLHMINKDVGTN